MEFQRCYGLDLSVEIGRMSARRLLNLVWHLPQDGAFGALLREQNSKERVTGVADLAAWFGRIRKS